MYQFKKNSIYIQTYSFVRKIAWLKWLILKVLDFYERIKIKAFLWKSKRELSTRWDKRENGVPHRLPAQLIVSLTSYPKRFRTLHLTLKCLLTQTVAADKIILWIADYDKDGLTDDILSLTDKGLEIRYCDDLRSYKKIIPTLKMSPDAFIVTADDDVYYWATWLEELIHAYSGNHLEILCHRAHAIILDDSGLPLPYNQWKMDIDNNELSKFNFPTGVGGVMYPPNIFHPDVLEMKLCMKLCPIGDDIWLYWMARRNKAKSRKIGTKRLFLVWPETIENALFIENVSKGGNDRQIRLMINKFGFPNYEQ